MALSGVEEFKTAWGQTSVLWNGGCRVFGNIHKWHANGEFYNVKWIR